MFGNICFSLNLMINIIYNTQQRADVLEIRIMYVQYDIDIIAILILIVVLVNNKKNSGDSIVKQWLFRALIVTDILLLFFDMFMLIIYAMPGSTVNILLNILQSFFFAACSLFCFFWALFCLIRPGVKYKDRHMILLCLPFLALVVCLFINYSNGMIFRITPENTYERGAFFHITSLCTYSYVIFSIVQVIFNKRGFSKKEYYPYLIVPLFPMVMGVVQLMFQIEVLMVWPSVAVSVLIVQLYVLDEKLSIDHLTGLYNRKYLDTYIEDLLNINRINGQGKNKHIFAALMLDLDNFKVINDTYGHVEGDNALIAASKLLSHSVRKGDFVSRYGGDEFLIILDQCTKNTPGRVIKRIEDNVSILNEEHKLPYDIEFSIGYRVFSNLEGLTSEKIFSSIDELMYKNKQSKLGSRQGISQIRFDI